MYAEDFEGNLPPDNNNFTLLAEWNRARVELRWFACPAAKNTVNVVADLNDAGAATNSTGMSYFYRGGLRLPPEGNVIGKTPLMWDQSRANHRKFVTVFYLNGDIETIKKDFPLIEH